VSHLSLLIESSRKVTNLNELRDLLICDCVKCGLSEGSLSHVLRVETTFPKAWALRSDLAEMLDVYYANYDKNEKPKASAIGICSRPSFAGTPRYSVYSKTGANKDDFKPLNKVAEVKIVPVVAKSKSEAAAKRCFKCNSPGHFVSACPQRATGHSVRSNKCAISNLHVSLESGDQLIERAPGAHVSTVGF